MIEHQGEEWGAPAEVGEQLGVRATCVRDWVRDGLLSDGTEVRRKGRFLYVKLTAAARVEKATRGRGRPRLDIPC